MQTKKAKGEVDKTTKEYKAKRMREYRAGRRLRKEQETIRKNMVEDRLNGDNIYVIGLRYGYNPTYITRLFSDLPIQKHKNRHKLFWGYLHK